MTRLVRSWRWAAVVAGVAVLAAIPALAGALPVRATAVAPAQLAAAVTASTAHPYSGYVETSGLLGLPDLSGVDVATSLLGSASKIRIWRAGPAAWRADLLSPTGETDTYGDATGTWTWTSADRRVWRTAATAGALRVPRADDVVPPELGRRILAAAAPGEIKPLGAARIAGRSVPGVRVVPASTATTIDHVDIWADASTGVVLRVAVVPRGSDRPAFESQFLDVSLSPPDAKLVTFQRPLGARTRRSRDPDLVQEVEQYSPVRLPVELAGLTRGTPRSSIATYGDGFDVVTVAAVRSDALGFVLPDRFPFTDRAWGGQARVVTTPLANAMALTAGGLGYVVAGAVTVDELDRIAAVINTTRPGQ